MVIHPLISFETGNLKIPNNVPQVTIEITAIGPCSQTSKTFWLYSIHNLSNFDKKSRYLLRQKSYPSSRICIQISVCTQPISSNSSCLYLSACLCFGITNTNNLCCFHVPSRLNNFSAGHRLVRTKIIFIFSIMNGTILQKPSPVVRREEVSHLTVFGPVHGR